MFICCDCGDAVRKPAESSGSSRGSAGSGSGSRGEPHTDVNCPRILDGKSDEITITPKSTIQFNKPWSYVDYQSCPIPSFNGQKIAYDYWYHLGYTANQPAGTCDVELTCVDLVPPLQTVHLPGSYNALNGTFYYCGGGDDSVLCALSNIVPTGLTGTMNVRNTQTANPIQSVTMLRNSNRSLNPYRNDPNHPLGALRQQYLANPTDPRWGELDGSVLAPGLGGWLYKENCDFHWFGQDDTHVIAYNVVRIIAQGSQSVPAMRIGTSAIRRSRYSEDVLAAAFQAITDSGNVVHASTGANCAAWRWNASVAARGFVFDPTEFVIAEYPYYDPYWPTEEFDYEFVLEKNQAPGANFASWLDAEFWPAPEIPLHAPPHRRAGGPILGGSNCGGDDICHSCGEDPAKYHYEPAWGGLGRYVFRNRAQPITPNLTFSNCQECLIPYDIEWPNA